VVSVPGASAVLAALVVAGLPTTGFSLKDFCPEKRREAEPYRRACRHSRTLVFFESARRVADTLGDLAAVLGSRDAAIARELTKHFETVRRGLLPELASLVAAEARPKAKLSSSLVRGRPAAVQEDVDARLGKALEGLSVKDAAAVVSAETGQPRRKVYARAIELSSRER